MSIEAVKEAQHQFHLAAAKSFAIIELHGTRSQQGINSLTDVIQAAKSLDDEVDELLKELGWG